MGTNPTDKQYRIVALLPTEMYVDSNDIDTAIETVNWLKTEYPSVEYPVSGEEGIDDVLNATPVILCVQKVLRDDDDDDYEENEYEID